MSGIAKGMADGLLAVGGDIECLGFTMPVVPGVYMSDHCPCVNVMGSRDM